MCAHTDVKTALVHEWCHLRRGDPGLILAVNLVRRLYCWNLVVALLCRQLLLLFEQACDAKSAQVLGKSDYQRSLARLLLEAHADDDMTLVPEWWVVAVDTAAFARSKADRHPALRRFTATVMILAAGLLAVSAKVKEPGRCRAIQGVPEALPSTERLGVQVRWLPPNRKG